MIKNLNNSDEISLQLLLNSTKSIEISIEDAFSQNIQCTPQFTNEMDIVCIESDDENENKGKNLKRKQNFGDDNSSPKKQKTNPKKRKQFSSLSPSKKQKIIENIGDIKEKLDLS